MATECSNTEHSAAFPVDLPAWFTKLLTQPGDMVLDPFIGSGSAAVAASQLSRKYVGVELSAQYCTIACRRLGLHKYQLTLPNLKEECQVYA
jgi:DNA modification methylase